MTGEKTKSDLTRELFPDHFAIADALNGHVEPFDIYQGPYICIGEDVRSGTDPYAIAVTGLGVVRLWLLDEGAGLDCVYNEANGKRAWFIQDDKNSLIEAARNVL